MWPQRSPSASISVNSLTSKISLLSLFSWDEQGIDYLDMIKGYHEPDLPVILCFVTVTVFEDLEWIPLLLLQTGTSGQKHQIYE